MERRFRERAAIGRWRSFWIVAATFGLFLFFDLSLGPSLALQLAGSQDRLLGGLAIGLLAGVGAIAIVVVRSWPPRRAMIVGGSALVVGLALTISAIAATAPVFYFAATAVTGVGFGVAWLGVLRSLVGLASPTARSELL